MILPAISIILPWFTGIMDKRQKEINKYRSSLKDICEKKNAESL
jgi:hypothetical protein